MSNLYNKNKHRITNIKSIILKESNNNFGLKSKNLKLSTTYGKIISNIENDLVDRREFNIKKYSKINKTHISGTTRDLENGNFHNNYFSENGQKVIFINNTKSKKVLSKDNKTKGGDLSFNKNKLITVKKAENINNNKNLLKIYKHQCKLQRPLSAYSDIKLKKLKIAGCKDTNGKNKFINKCIMKQNFKIKKSRNVNMNINNNYLLSDLNESNAHNLTQRNTYANHHHKNLLLTLKDKVNEKSMNTSRKKNKANISRHLTDDFLNHSAQARKYNKNFNKEKEKLYFINTYDEQNISLNKNSFNKYNTFNNNKKCIVSIIKPTKKIINKTLPDREKILDSVRINNFNSNNYLLSTRHKQKTSNILYKIPLDMRTKLKNKLNNSITKSKNKNTHINNYSLEKNSKKISNKNDNKMKKKLSNSNKKNINKINSYMSKNEINSNSNSNCNNHNNSINNKLLNYLIKPSMQESNPKNIIFSPNTPHTNENTITSKEVISKRIMKIDSCTIAGYSSPGVQKINQDNFFIKKEFLGEQEQFLLGVCDGHGTYGHLVSEYITKTLPNFLRDNSDEAIISGFITTNNTLINNSKIDCSLSGSTCTTLIINLDKIICANLGDSRAVLARYEKGIYSAVDLSNDHKPSDPNEMKRILIKGGRIKPFYDEELKKFLGPERVWLKNSDIPGLAMTRSIGDHLAHSVGVISEPEIKRYEFNGNEKFIVLASDGIWEYIDSDECVNIVKDYYENDMDAIGALNSLVKEAFNRWKSMEESIDDITAIVIFFE